ncbi:MAG: TonB-dependent receptor plug domain-containing protein, partial [Calditrichia bacterium]
GYGVGSFAGGSINLRGLGGKPNTGVLVLINGRPDFMGIFGHPLPDVYGLANNDKIEVIKGPSSTVFGSNAMGGAVNIITSSPVQNRINLKTQGGSYNTFNQYIGSGYVAGKTSFSINAKHQKTSGHIDSTAFEIYTLGAKLSQQLRNTWQINLEGRFVPYTFDDPQMGPDVANLGTYAKIRRGMADIEISGSAGKLKNSFHLYSNLGHHRFNDGFESHDFSYGLSSYQRYAYSNQIQFSAGLDVLRYGGKAKNVVNPQAPPKSDLHTVNSIGGYILGFYSPLTILNFQGGLRYQYVSLDITKVTPTFGISLYPLSY